MSENQKPIKLLLVERHAMLREALRGLLSASPDLVIIGECGQSGAEFVTQTQALRPDLVVVHLHAGDDDTLKALCQIVTEPDHPPALVITTDSPESATNQAALHCGAAGLLEMKEPPETLVKAIRCLHAGELWIDRRTTARVVKELRQQRTAGDIHTVHPKDMLSPREKQIVGLVASGLSTEAIAEQLFISEKTVRNHLVSIYAKLDVSNRIQLALCASKMGIS